MADSNFRGPISAMGPLEIDNGTSPTVLPLDGPSMFYQGLAMSDIRSAPFAKDGFRPGQQPAFAIIPTFYAVDNFPQAASTTLLAASQAATAATALALVTAQVSGPGAGIPSFAINIPVQPSTAIVTPTFMLDFGFATGTTAANSTTVVVNDNTQFQLGQWVIVAGAGNASGTAPLISQVASIATANITGLTLTNAAATAFSNVPIGAGSLFGGAFLPTGTQFGPATATANRSQLRSVAGLAKVFNPREAITRNISITAGTTTATTAVTVLGYDVWLQPMSEAITVPSGNRSATTFFGAKAFKHIVSATVQTTAGGSLSMGVGDVFGVPVRADTWEQNQIYWNGCYVPTKLGFTAAGTTSPATNTTGDVRGTIQVSTNGTGTAAAVATASVSNGTARLTIIQNPGVWNVINGTPLNTVPMFGVTNSTT